MLFSNWHEETFLWDPQSAVLRRAVPVNREGLLCGSSQKGNVLSDKPGYSQAAQGLPGSGSWNGLALMVSNLEADAEVIDGVCVFGLPLSPRQKSLHNHIEK
jgi:hypothetical protein